MAMTFDATLKDMARESPEGFLTTFDRPPSLPVRELNVDLATVTKTTDFVLGLGEPLEEIVHFDFQSGPAAWKHADLLAYNAILFSQHHVPVHTVLVLLREGAAHSNQDGSVRYSPRYGRGKMDFAYQIERLWERPAEELLAGDIGVAPLAMLGRMPEELQLEDGLAAIARRVVERVMKEAPADRAKKLLIEALLLTGLRVSRGVAKSIFRGVHAMEESDTYLMIVDEGREKQARNDVLLIGTKRLGAPAASDRTELNAVTDLDRLQRMVLSAVTAASWREILDTK
jgi:hypothetical protein